MHKLTLHSVLSPSVFTVTPSASLPDVLASMESLRISCVVAVDAEHKPVGIFTEQDAISLMAERKVVAELRMADVMSAPPLTAPADMDFRDAYQLMSGKGYRHLTIIDNEKKLVGIVSEADFMHHMGMEYLVELKTVSSAMTSDLVTLKEDATLADAVDLMSRHKISCVIVTRDQKPIGILTERDTVSLARTISDPTRVQITRVMKSPVQTIDAQYPLQQAMALMETSSIRRLVVVEGEILKGLVTRHDIVKNMQGRYIEFLHETLERQRKDLHHAQKQVKQTRQQLLYHSLMEQVNDAIFVSQEKTGIIIDCNDQACRSLGYTRGELLRMTIFDIATSISPGKQWETEVALFDHEGRRLVETQHRRRDGSVFPVEVNASLIQKDNERYIVAVARDLTERKQAESQLRLQDTALNSTANAIVITNNDAVIQWANPAFSEMTGYAVEEALGKHPKDLVRSGVQPREFYEVLWSTILSGQVWRGEVVNKRKDGTLYTEEMTITPVHAEDKVITHFIAVKQDITLRKRAEDDLRLSEQTYRGLLNSVGDAIYVQDKQGRFLDVNETAEKMYGYTRDELIGKTPEFLSAPGRNDLAALDKAIQKGFTGISQIVEFWGIRKNGEVFPKEVMLTRGSYFGSDALIAVARDITERKKSEEQIVASEKTYRSILNSTNETICILNDQRRFLDVNIAAERAYGYERHELIGRTPEFLFDPDASYQSCLPPIFSAAAAGTPQFFEYGFVNKRGERSVREVSLTLGKYFDRPAFIVVTRDITKRKEIEEKLQEAAAVMQNTHEGVMITDTIPNVIAVNAAYTKITGFPPEETIGRNPSILNSGRHDKPFYEQMWCGLKEGGYWQGEIWDRRKSGEVYPQLLTISAINDEQGRPIRYIGVFTSSWRTMIRSPNYLIVR
ncbi:MAG: hypothetical protein FD121_1148 [Gallionellaceae bacterium]|nr:MAG: hypothetical protein FD121_1148 [Gallionellaceae bacterium]